MSEVSLHPLNRLTTLTNRDDQALVVVGSGQGSTADATETRTALGLGDSATQDAADLPVSTATQAALDEKRDLVVITDEDSHTIVTGAHYRMAGDNTGLGHELNSDSTGNPFVITIDTRDMSVDDVSLKAETGGATVFIFAAGVRGVWRVVGNHGLSSTAPPTIESITRIDSKYDVTANVITGSPAVDHGWWGRRYSAPSLPYLSLPSGSTVQYYEGLWFEIKGGFETSEYVYDESDASSYSDVFDTSGSWVRLTLKNGNWVISWPGVEPAQVVTVDWAQTIYGEKTFVDAILNDPLLEGYTEATSDLGSSGTSKTISISAATSLKCTLTGNCTFTMPTAVNGKSFTLRLHTGTGGFIGTFVGVRWPGGVTPVITTTANRMDLVSFVSDGTRWYGSILQDFTP